MPRPLRVQYPGAIDHVMSRANGQGDVFHNGVDRQGFLQTLAEAKAERIIGQSLQRLHLGAWQSLNNQLYLRHTRK